MDLSGHPFRYAYGPQDDRVNDFYVPALSLSTRYDRSAGFFSSSALSVAAAGIARLIENDGRMRLLAGAQLQDADVEALLGGADLARLVEKRMSQSLEQKIDAIAQERLAALAWMIKNGTLEVRVVLPTAEDGRPLAASECRDYFHTKTGIFTDRTGNRVAFAGSINEGEQAWLFNYENFSVFCSWKPDQVPYIDRYQLDFDRLWEGKEKGWRAIPIPDAVRQRLLRYCPRKAPARDPLESPPPVEDTPVSRESILFSFLRDAPLMPNAEGLGQESFAVRLWPHQARVVQKVVSTFPERYLLCDEVGLGKTLEAGAIIKQLTLSGRVRRCLILAPKSVCRQWQEELYESFLLNMPEFDGNDFHDYFGRSLTARAENPWDAFPLLIASSQLAKRRERTQELLRALPWDLVLVDEAHHARRMDFLSGRYRRNRLLSLLLGAQDAPGSAGLADRTKGLLLMTATPMQVDAREVWDLLTVLGLGGKWGASDELFMRFFQEVRNGAEADWRLLLSLVRDHLENGGVVDPLLDKVGRECSGAWGWGIITQLPFSGKARSEIAQLDSAGKAMLMEFVRRTTPLSRYLFRNTRALLRKYQERGLLGDRTVPTRKPELVWISMTAEERELYERIEEYISDFYRIYEEKRAGLGFIMTVYRRRLTSSFHAIERSLEKRLEFLRGDSDRSATSGLSDEDFEEDELSEDALENMGPEDQYLASAEISYIEDFLQCLHALGSDSKAERLLQEIPRLLARRETLIIFTVYTDTMDYLRDLLCQVYGSQVGCYSGRGGEVWDGQGWQRISKARLKEDFAKEKIKILLGTEAMSEGLNLQTCGMMINYDMPWNPMRVEQRIGRIDRIEQRYPEVWIWNYFYEDTVEANIYKALEGRISWFETVVGTLQPILASVAKAIRNVAMEGQEARPRRFSEAVDDIRRQLDEQDAGSLDLGSYLGLDEEAPYGGPVSPATRQDIEKTILGSSAGRSFLHPNPVLPGAYQLMLDGKAASVTFDADLFSSHPDELHLLSWGEPLFHRLLEGLCGSDNPDLPPWLVRFVSPDPMICGWWRLDVGKAAAVRTMAELSDALSLTGAAVGPAAHETARVEFNRAVEEFISRERTIVSVRLKARTAALRERGRRLLMQAAHLMAALKDENPSFLGAEAVVGLKDLGFPFTALIAQVTVQGIDLSLTDPEWERARDASTEQRRRRMEELKRRMKELVHELSKSQHAGPDKGSGQ